MAQVDERTRQLIRSIAPLGLIFLLVHLIEAAEVISDVSRWLIVAVASLFGLQGSDGSVDISIAGITLPWTQDCSGVNSLILLWAVTLWMNRDRPLALSSLMRLALCVPLALAVNVARVFTIAAYRYVFYPEWETGQLHYFFGFIWLLPCVPFLVRDVKDQPAVFWINITYMSVVLSLMAPVIFDSGGTLVALCTLLILAHNAYRPLRGKAQLWLVPWFAFGLFIAAAASEGFWILWLLIAPHFVHRKLLSSMASVPIFLGCVSVIAMNLTAQVVIEVAAIIYFVRLVRSPEALTLSLAGQSNSELSTKTCNFPDVLQVQHITLESRAGAALFLMLLMPFILPLIFDQERMLQPPPGGVMSRQLAFNTYQIKVRGQATDLASFWFGPFGDGRHHSLVSCMQFQGVALQKVDEHPQVFTDQEKWMTEYFIVDGALIDNYYEYLLLNVIPFSDLGIHLILEAPKDEMSVVFFIQESDRVSRQIVALSDSSTLPGQEVFLAAYEQQGK